MDLNSNGLSNPLKEARTLEDDGEYDQAKKMFLGYFDACIKQSKYRPESLQPNTFSALKGATRCLMKLNKVSEAEELLKKNLAHFGGDVESPSSARMRSRIEALLSDVLKLKRLVDRFYGFLDDFVSGPSSDRKGSGVQGRDNLAVHLNQTIHEIILYFYHQKIKGEDAIKSLVDSVVAEIKSSIGEEITWEPQYFSFMATEYANLGFHKDAIELGLYALELAKRTSADTPKNYRLREESMRLGFIEWYLTAGDLDESEKWLPERTDYRSLNLSGHHYLKMKKYGKAKECFEETLTDESHLWAFTYELMDFCDKRLGNKTNEELLRHALETYEQREPKGFMDEYFSRLAVLRVKDSLEGVKEARYLSLINELNRESMIEDTTLSLIPTTFYLYLIGVCYLRIGDREKAFRSFDRVIKIEREDRFTWNWTAEPDYSDFYDGVWGEMVLRELYDDRFRVARFPRNVLKFEFTEEEFKTFTGRTKKEHLEEGVQGEPDEVLAIVKTPFF